MDDRLPGRTNTAVARGEVARATILEAAAELFAEYGYHATTLSQVGAQAGIKRPAVLHHFASKELLLHAVLDRHEQRFMRVRLEVAQYRGLAGIRQLIRITEFQEENRRRTMLWNMLLAESASPDSPLRARMRDDYEQFRFSITFLLGQAQEDGALRPGLDFTEEANIIIAFFNGMETSWLLDPEVPMVAIVERFLDERIERMRAPQPDAAVKAKRR